MHVLWFLAKLEHFTHVGRSFIEKNRHIRHPKMAHVRALGNPRMVHPGQIQSRNFENSHPKWLRLQTKYLNTCLISFIRLDDIWFCYSMMSWTWEHSTTIQGHPQMGFPDRFTLCGVATVAVALFRPRAEPLPLAETGGCEIIIPKWPLQ